MFLCDCSICRQSFFRRPCVGLVHLREMLYLVSSSRLVRRYRNFQNHFLRPLFLPNRLWSLISFPCYERFLASPFGTTLRISFHCMYFPFTLLRQCRFFEVFVSAIFGSAFLSFDFLFFGHALARAFSSFFVRTIMI